MSSLGELYFSLGLDSQKFDDAIKEAKKKVAELTGEASITINADASNVAAQVQDDLNKITGKKAEIKLGIDKSSKASVEDLVKDIANAEKELERLKSKESWNTSAIERQEGFINILKKQLEEAKAVKVAATEAKEAINDMAQSSQSVQHVINEEDINLVRELKEELVGVNRQFEVRNRLEQGKIDAAEKNKAERQALEEEKALNDFISNARKKRAAAAKEEAQAELEAAKKKESAAKESNKALESQLAQLFKLEEAIKKLQNLQVKLNTSGINTNTMEFKDASSALDEYIQKLQKMQGLGLALNKRDVQSALGVDMSNVMSRTNSFISEQVKLEKKAASEAARASKEKERQVKLVDRIKNGLKNSSDWASQFNNQITNAFSLYSIERFIRNLYTIGGEFQKQQIALQAMIGDADKGNAIFERAKGLAVISPFTFSEISSYTKQMSAYGIEYEELYDTTKRLADISAGVGVDMGRLILAFGQVRSAAVLRGQELRQFTEAGIPLVAELAKRFTELEGKAVSTGEVFDKISKRQVSFGMVKDILFDMTDPGGRFFKMQEEQAKSLAGQWSNLKDAWDIMVADIANASSGALGILSSTIKDILDTWRAWSPVLLGIVGLIGTYSAAIRIAELATSALNLVTNANPWVKVISVVVSATSAIIGYQIATKDATKTIEDLNVEFEKSKATAEDNERTANRYLDILSKSTDKEDEKLQLQRKQQIALEELTRMYEPLFKNMNLESMTLDVIARKRAEINEMTKKNTLESFRDNRAQMISMKLSMERELATMEKTNKSNKNPLIDSDFFKSLGGKFNDWFGTSDEDIAKKKQDILEITQAISDLDDEIKTTAEAESWEELKKKLSLSSTVDEYVAVYGEIGKAVKILREKGITDPIIDPKMGTSVIEYNEELNKLLKEQKGIMDDFSPNTDTHKNAADLAKIYESAIKAIGGVPFSKKTSGKSEAEKAAERDAKAYLDALKAKLSELGSQWDLYKDLFEATGDRRLSMNIAFDGVIPNFDNYISHLRGLMQEEIQKRGLGISVSDLLSEGKEGIAKRVNDKSQTAWTEDAAKNLNAIIDSYNNANKKLREESVRNFIDIIKNSKDFAQQIADIDRELQKDLSDLAKMSGGTDSELYNRRAEELIKRAEEEKTKVNFEEFKKSSDWVKVFDDLDRVSDATLDNMISKIEEFARQAGISEEVTKQLVEAMGKLRDENIERNPLQGFNDAWGRMRDIKDAFKRGQMDDGLFYLKQSNGTYKGLTEKELNDEQADANEDLKDSALAVADKFQAVANAADLLDGIFSEFGVNLGGLSDALGNIANGATTGAGVANAFGATGPWGAIVGASVGMMSSIFNANDRKMDRLIELAETRKKISENISNNLEMSLDRMMGGIYQLKLDDETKSYLNNVVGGSEEYLKALSDYKNGLDGGIDTLKTLAKGSNYSEDTINSILEALEEDSYFDAQLANLKIQRDDVRKQLESEQDKGKDKSEDKIESYKQELKELENSIRYFAEDMANALYGIDFKDWAGQLTESIVNAWASGEDAAKAYENTVSDIMRNVAVKMAQQSIIEKYMNDFLKPFLDEFTAKNGVMDSEMYSELANIVDGTGARIGQVQDFLEQLEKVMNEKGLTLKEESESSSSGLSKGIQSITEDTANLLGSYLNAIRQDSSVQRTLIEHLVSVDVPKINYIAEAQLRELSQIQSNTARNVVLVGEIRDLVNKVVDKGGNKLRI